MMNKDTQLGRSVSAPMDSSVAARVAVGSFPPVLVMYHPTMEQLARKLTTKLQALSLSAEVCIFFVCSVTTQKFLVIKVNVIPCFL